MIIISISILLNIILIVALFAAIKIIKNKLKVIDKYEEWVVLLNNKLHSTYIRLKNIDDRQMFEKDDDVGFVFNDILQLIKEIDEKTEQQEEQENKEIAK